MDPQSTRVGWVGTGVMGASMAGHLLAAGHPLTIHTRSREKASALEERGAEWADSPADVAAASDITFAIAQREAAGVATVIVAGPAVDG